MSIGPLKRGSLLCCRSSDIPTTSLVLAWLSKNLVCLLSLGRCHATGGILIT